MTFINADHDLRSGESFAWVDAWRDRFDALARAWPHIRRDDAFHVIFRALIVAAPLSLAAVLLMTAAPKPPLTAPVKTVRRAPPSPVLQLAKLDGDFPLDSDFSLESAARTWAHRFGARDLAAPADAMRFGPVRVSRSVVERVVQAAKTTEMDPALLMAIADKESSFSTTAKANTSSASGLFQFIDSTWFKAMRAFGMRHGHEEDAKSIDDDKAPSVSPKERAKLLGLRNDPYLSAVMAAEMLKADGARIAGRIGRSLTAGETYLIHFLGPEDARRFMEKLKDEPQSSAAELLPRPARANKPIFYAQQGKKMKDKTVAEVHEAFEAMMGQRTSRYENVAARLPKGALAYGE